MKKIKQFFKLFDPFAVFILSVIIWILVVSFTAPRIYKLKFDENQIVMLWKALNFSKKAIQTSQEPAIDVRNATVTIDSLQTLISKQYMAQVQDSTKTKKDTTKTNK